MIVLIGKDRKIRRYVAVAPSFNTFNPSDKENGKSQFHLCYDLLDDTGACRSSLSIMMDESELAAMHFTLSDMLP